jgi:acyl-CoA synthetase (AMP-forming)/AMP-acid ligase II
VNLAALLFARRQPAAPAVSDRVHAWSYREFARRIACLAGGLAARSLGPGERVMLCMENCAEFLEMMFACWTAGLCAVPVNARLHPREVEYIARDSGARLLIATPALAGVLGPLEQSVEILGPIIATASADYTALMTSGDPMRPIGCKPTDRAWLFYTSGTTGRPKGAVLSHRNLLFMSHCYYADIETVDERDTNLHAGPLSHGAGLYALPHLLRGGHQVVLPHFDIDAIVDALQRHSRVSMFAAPTMLTRLIRAPAVAEADLRNLRTISYGGGPMYVADLERALQLFGPRLYQLYGQGESPMTITGLTKRMHADQAHPRWRERLNPVASAETLRGGWLHTGDLGSFDEDGFLTLRDRSKDMIISGGSNIYPREIEEVLLRHPDLVEVSVVGRPHPEWGEEVVAFVVSRPGTEIATDTLDRLCLDHIARFKRPREYRFVDALPKNNYGKVLKTELRRML